LFAHEVFSLKSELTMSNLSFLNVPYRFKAGTLYSQIPESGLGDFVVSRSASNAATRVNAQGFIETVADNVPRLDYPLGGIANGCPALLVEPSAQNLALQSETLNTSPWGTSSATVTPNAILSPSNTLTADQINYTANVASRALQIIASSNSTTYTYSVFVKNNTFLAGELVLLRFENALSAPNNFEIRAVIDPTNIGATTFSLIGTAGTGTSGTVSGSVEDYGNGWWRVRVTGTTGTAAASATASIRIQQSSSAIARSLYAWGAQLETGSVATSYIPTTTAAITRGADVISKTGVSSLIGQTEGTIYAEFSVDFNNRNADILSINAGNSNNGFFMSLRDTSVVQLIVRTLGNNELIFQRVGAFSIGVNKLAMAYKNGDFAICLNGTAVQTNTNNITMPSVSINKIGLGDSALYALDRQLRIRATALLPTRLTNAQLQALTT
jgi:hypothetical protein